MSIRNTYTNFSSHLDPGETQFILDNPNKYDDGIQRGFSFGHLQIVPEYVAEIAESENMDDLATNPNEVVFENRFVIFYLPEYFDPSDNRRMACKFSKGPQEMPEVIMEINNTFDLNKPLGMNFCPVFVDWTHPILQKYSDEILKYHQVLNEIADSLYNDDEGFSEITHKGYLPPLVRDEAFNDWKLPSHANYLKDTRIRLIIMPGFRLVFSNDSILNAMGFDKKVYGGKRSATNQFVITNKSISDVAIYIADKPPQANFDLNLDVKVHVVNTNKFNRYSFRITSSSVKEKNIGLLVEEVNKNIKAIGLSIGYELSVKLNAEKKVEFQMPRNDEIQIRLVLSERLSRIFKMSIGQSVSSENLMSMDPVGRQVLNPNDGLMFSNILTLDTGPLTVSFHNSISRNTTTMPNPMMAYLKSDGPVSTMITDFKPPVVLFPKEVKRLIFRINRNSDKDKVIGLNWPVGCFIHGVLVGTPI